MSGFSSFGPGGPRRECDPVDGVANLISEEVKEFMGLTLAELKEKQAVLDEQYGRVFHDLKIASQLVNSGLVGKEEEAKRQGLLTQKERLYYRIQAVQDAIEANNVLQEVPKVKE